MSRDVRVSKYYCHACLSKGYVGRDGHTASVRKVRNHKARASAARPLRNQLVEESLMRRSVSAPGSLPCVPNSAEGSVIVPVVASNNDGVLAKVVSIEIPVVVVEGTIAVDEFREMANNPLVESDLVVTGPPDEVPGETVKPTTELLENDSLDFDFADGLSDDSIGTLVRRKNCY